MTEFAQLCSTTQRTWGGGCMGGLGRPGFIIEIPQDLSCIFCFKIIRFLEKEVHKQPAAPSCPAMRKHGAQVYFRALSSLSFCLKKKKQPPPHPEFLHT